MRVSVSFLDYRFERVSHSYSNIKSITEDNEDNTIVLSCEEGIEFSYGKDESLYMEIMEE